MARLTRLSIGLTIQVVILAFVIGGLILNIGGVRDKIAGKAAHDLTKTIQEHSSSAPPSPLATTAPTPVPQTAKAMIRGLKKRHAPIIGIVIYNAKTDENHLLGRPNGYLSKGAWRDSRIPASETPGYTLGDIDVGGGIEVFASRERAIERGGYIQSLGTPITNEYDYVCGQALLRISGYLTPKQARGYRHLLAHVVRQPCTPVT